LLPVEFEEIGGTISALCGGWARPIELNLFSYEEALKVGSVAAPWIQFAKHAALGSHPYVQEDGPELPQTGEPHAVVGVEVLEGMLTDGCTSIEDSRVLANSRRAGGLGAVSGASPNPVGIVSKDPRVVPT
jgi:hypothetical protein